MPNPGDAQQRRSRDQPGCTTSDDHRSAIDRPIATPTSTPLAADGHAAAADSHAAAADGRRDGHAAATTATNTPLPPTATNTPLPPAATSTPT